MAETLLRTGVELRLPQTLPDGAPGRLLPQKPGEVMIEVQVFAELEEDGAHQRIGGTSATGKVVPLSDDPTKALTQIAQEAREMHLGDLLGDLRRSGCDVTRFEFYATPFKIELAEDLRQRLAGSWRERPPR
jgi:hypothetical protein